MGSLAKSLKKHRLEAQLSLSEVARRAQISKAYLSQLEHGDSKQPSYSVLARIATALGVSVAELTGGEPPSRNWNEADRVPSSLRRFAEEADIPSGDVKMLSTIHFRGRRPREASDWAHIYETIKRTVR